MKGLKGSLKCVIVGMSSVDDVVDEIEEFLLKTLKIKLVLKKKFLIMKDEEDENDDFDVDDDVDVDVDDVVVDDMDDIDEKKLIKCKKFSKKLKLSEASFGVTSFIKDEEDEEEEEDDDVKVMLLCVFV